MNDRFADLERVVVASQPWPERGALPAGLIRAARAIVVGAKPVPSQAGRAADQVLPLHEPGHGTQVRSRDTTRFPRPGR